MSLTIMTVVRWASPCFSQEMHSVHVLCRAKQLQHAVEVDTPGLPFPVGGVGPLGGPAPGGPVGDFPRGPSALRSRAHAAPRRAATGPGAPQPERAAKEKRAGG